MSRKVSAFLLLFFLFFSTPVFSKALLPTSLPLPSEIPHSIKVGLFIEVPSVSVGTDGPYMLKVAGAKEPLFEGNALHGQVSAEAGGIRVGDRIFSTERLTITVSAGSIEVGKRKYGRQIEIIKKPGNKISVVNHVDFEEYLKGVLPLEVHPDWSLESLKAQAVTSRTFALFKMIEKKDLDYAVVDTVQSQVFGGSLFHKESTSRAIDLTRGEILTSGGKLFPSYFHAACGGRTAQADKIWVVEPNPVLKGVTCNFCKASKHWRWTLKIPVKKIEEIMQEKGYPAKNLSGIQFAGRDLSGRVSRVILKYKLSSIVIRADDFRSWIGYDRLKSLKASVDVKGGLVYFVGYGWGHGIGLCQWGAKGQADLGKKYPEILAFYFPGSELKKY